MFFETVCFTAISGGFTKCFVPISYDSTCRKLVCEQRELVTTQYQRGQNGGLRPEGGLFSRYYYPIHPTHITHSLPPNTHKYGISNPFQNTLPKTPRSWRALRGLLGSVYSAAMQRRSREDGQGRFTVLVCRKDLKRTGREAKRGQAGQVYSSVQGRPRERS